MNRKVKVFLFACMAVALLAACGGGGGGGRDTTSWTGAVEIDAGAHYAYAPQVAFDANGNAIAVWEEYDGTSTYDIYANRYDTGTGWGTAEIIDAGAHYAYAPQVAFDANGNAVAVWYQYDGSSTYDIYANRYDAGTGWEGAVEIDAGANNASSPQVAFEANGNAIAVWCQYNGTSAYDIYANRYDTETGWEGVVEIDAGANNAYDPQVAVDASGNAIAVWYQYDDTYYYSIYANRYDAGIGLWGTAEIIDAGANNAYDPQVAVDASGNAIAVWKQDAGRYTYEFHRVNANRYDVGTGSWGTATEIDTGANYESRVPQVAVDASGNAFAVWKQHDGTYGWRIYAKRYDAGTGWEGAVEIDAGTSNYDPQVSFDANGNAFAVWQQWDGTYLSIYARRYDAGTGWGTAEIIDAGANDASSPQVSFDTNGNAFAVWIQYDDSTSTTSSIYANRYE